jgi:hypothetical protein
MRPAIGNRRSDHRDAELHGSNDPMFSHADGSAWQKSEQARPMRDACQHPCAATHLGQPSRHERRAFDGCGEEPGASR